jgi:hypothetical protein
MRRALTLFTGSGLATATTASALAAFTTLTLVAGGFVITGVMNAGKDRTVLALPAIGEPLGPIIIARDDLVRPPAGTVAAAATGKSARARNAAPANPTRTVSLTDADRVRGTVTTALDAGEPGRMEEVGPIEQIESIIKNSQEGHTTSDDDGTDGSDESGSEESEGAEDDGVLVRIAPVVQEADATAEEEPVTELVYSGTDAGSASPSA